MPAKTLVELEQERRKAAESNGGYQVRRVLPGLVDMSRPDNRHEQGVVRQDGYTYHYEYWTQQGGLDAGRVSVEVERDVLTGDAPGPWNLSDRWGTRPTFVMHPPWPDPPPATHEFRLAPIPTSPTPRYDLIERVHHLNHLPQEPLVASREYDAPGRRSFTDELLPTPEECPPAPPRADKPRSNLIRTEFTMSILDDMMARLPAEWVVSEPGDGTRAAQVALPNGLFIRVAQMGCGGVMVTVSLLSYSMAVAGGDPERQVRRMVRSVLVEAAQFSPPEDWDQVARVISDSPPWASGEFSEAFRSAVAVEISDFRDDMTTDEREHLLARMARFGTPPVDINLD